MSTLISSTAAYFTAAQVVQRVDVRVLGDWLSDAEVRLTSSQVTGSTVLAALMFEAQGELEAACLAGDRYTPADLVKVATASPTTGATELLLGILSGITLGKCWERRPRTDNAPYPVKAQWARQMVEQLRTGTHIFGFQEDADAGRIDHARMTPQDVRDQRLLTGATRKYFGRRGGAGWDWW